MILSRVRLKKRTDIATWRRDYNEVRKRAVGERPRIEAKVSAAARPDERWSTDLCRVWGGRDGWLVVALVIDCHTRQLLGWHLARTGKASTASAALEQALILLQGC